MSRSVAVVGAGVAGLAAAHRIRGLLEPVDVTVYEAAGRIGGLLRTVELAGVAYDVGAEAFLARRPEVPALLGELGLTAQLVHPSTAVPSVLAGRRVRALPPRTLLGIPSDAGSLHGVASTRSIARVAAEPSREWSWTPGADVSVGELVRERFGDEVVARSVDPLLGGVYSGSADSVGVRAATPTLAAALDGGAPGLLAAAAAAVPAPRPGVPVFGALRDGYTALLSALAETVVVRRCARVAGLRRAGHRFVLTVDGSDEAPVDAVVLAVPAPALRTLLAGVAAPAAPVLDQIRLAPVAVVGLAFPAATKGLPTTSGLLVATGEELHAKAFTHSSRKWPHLGSGPALIRASLGRYGQAGVLDRDDDELVALVRADLARVHGVVSRPLDAVVQRWPDGLPQYAPGHLDRVAAVERAVAAVPGLALAGSLLRGVGVPACISTGHAAAQSVVDHVTAGGDRPSRAP